jgi:epoxyqueuosine reductase
MNAPVTARTLVDTGPLLERDVAELAGLGFIGKNSLLIAPGQGSGVLLGSMVTNVDLSSPETGPKVSLPVIGRGCGSCQACLVACPTGAFVGDYVLDARLCISYLTIELIGAIPRELRSKIGMRIFGCDACQNVCPFNQTRRSRPSAPELTAKPIWQTRDLIDLLFLGSAQYRALIAGTALRRTFRVQLSRNAAIALGNSGDPLATEPLFRAATSHQFDLVKTHAAWALGELGTRHGLSDARLRLAELLTSPVDAVREEAHLWFQTRPPTI